MSHYALQRQSKLFLAIFSLALFFSSAVANADMDQIEVHVTPDMDDALGEVKYIIHFEEKILYEHHAPKEEGKLLRVFIRLTEALPLDAGFFEQTLWTKKIDRAPTLSATYPSADKSLLISFSHPTKYTVRPGSDGKSIVITVPLLPEAEAAAKPAAPVPAVKPSPVPPSPAPTLKPAPVTKPTPEATPAPLTPPAAMPQAVAPMVPAPQAQAQAEAPRKAEVTSSESKPAIKEAPLPAVIPPVSTPAETEKLANKYMAEARQAMTVKDYKTVLNRCYRILGLEQNSQSEPAQAWIGEVREANGEFTKARAEYELYLKIYPNGPSAARVKERLAALPKEKAAERSAKARPLPTEPGPAVWTYFGSVSANYYTGQSQTETLTTPVPGQIAATQSTLSALDQDSLITSVNLNARRRDAFSDMKIVVRGTSNQNFLNPSRSYRRLYSGYVERNDRHAGYNFRVGRQNPNGMGVLERFDGLQAGYNLGTDWKINGVYGEAVEFLSPFKKVFYGASVDFLPQAGRPGASVYAINQTLDGYQNRRALGSEVRYFDGHATGYGLLDYDVLYKGVNIALLQGNYLTEGGSNYYFTLDHRRAPSFSLTNALVAAPSLSLQSLIASQGLETTRNQAKSLSAISDLFSMGMNYPLTPQWQIGGDYQVSRISSTQQVVAVIPLGVIGTCVGVEDPVNQTCVIDTAKQQGSGNSHSVTLQAVGNNLFAPNAVGVGSLTFIKAPTFDGQSALINYTLPFFERWRLDSNFRYYTQKDNVGGSSNRISGSFKLSYQLNESWFTEAEIGEEQSSSITASSTDHVTRDYFYLGVRWEFR